MMRELPILFSTEMVRAILDGRKTQTRRVIKIDDPDEWCDPSVEKDPPLYKNYGESDELIDGLGVYAFWEHMEFGDVWETHKCPYGSPGDRLYVREKWNAESIDGIWWEDMPPDERMNFNWNLYYKANGHEVPKWKPSIHMPKKFARIWLRVTTVRVERLQEISKEDAIAEGVNWKKCPQYQTPAQIALMASGRACVSTIDYIGGFQRLWDSINAKRGYGWDTNPWVFVVEFEKEK